jgi:hypothetical protein
MRENAPGYAIRKQSRDCAEGLPNFKAWFSSDKVQKHLLMIASQKNRVSVT